MPDGAGPAATPDGTAGPPTPHARVPTARQDDRDQTLLEPGRARSDPRRRSPRTRAGRRRPSRATSLFSALPYIVTAIPLHERELAERVLLAPLLDACNEDLAPALASTSRDVFAFVLIDGVVLKETTFATRSALELLGPGDVFAPPLTASHQIDFRAVSRYLAHGPVTLAALDERFKQAARRWPGLSDLLHDRLGRQTHRASMHTAMLHLPRVEERIVALFSDLAERLGRMASDGILIDVPLTHELIGRLVGSRRPTVSIALQALDCDSVLRRLDDDRWKLAEHAILS